MKNNVKLFVGIIIGALISGSIVYAVTLIDSKDVTYTPSDNNFEVTNVEGALNTLYNKLDGKKTASGYVTIANAYTPAEVNIGFKPGYVATVFTDSAGTYISVYNKDWDPTHAQVNQYNYAFPTAYNSNSSNARVFELTDTGFKVKSNTVGNVKIYYFAIEE